jgi:broad specificity phosphatase PhoE
MRVTRVVTAALAAWLCAAGTVEASDQVIFLVRHAERTTGSAATGRATMMADDPPLSAAGAVRAAKLATLLASADIRHIYTTEFQRTRQTAAPLAAALHLQSIMAASRDSETLFAQVRKATGNVLIVGHSNTIPDLLKRLGVKEEIAIADTEYDNLFVLVRPATGAPTLVKLRDEGRGTRD